VSEPRKEEPEDLADPTEDPTERKVVKKAPVRAASRAPRAAAKSTAVKKSVVKRDLPITAIRASLQKAAEKLGEDKIPEYDVKKHDRSSSVPTAAPVSTKQIEDYLDKTATMKIPSTATRKPRAKTRTIATERGRSRSRKRKDILELSDPDPGHHQHILLIGVA
jgi:hypothetical protein